MLADIAPLKIYQKAKNIAKATVGYGLSQTGIHASKYRRLS